MKDSSLQLNWNNNQGVVGKVNSSKQPIRQNTYRSQKPVNPNESIALWKVVLILFAAATLLSFFN